MTKKLSEIQYPAIAGVVREKTVRAASAEIKNCLHHGAAMIDLHLSCLDNSDTDTLKSIISSTPLPILALNYNNTYDWNPANIDEDERVNSLLRAVEAGAAGIDMQGYTYHLPSKNGFTGEDKYSFTKGNPKEIVTDEAIIAKQCALIEKVHSMGAEVLLSCHPGITMKRDQVVDLALFLEKRKPDIIKIVTRAESDDDLIECIHAMLLLKKEIKTPIAYHTSGKPGLLSRIINPLLGGQIAFCVDHYTDSSTMEQLHLGFAADVVDKVKKMTSI